MSSSRVKRGRFRADSDAGVVHHRQPLNLNLLNYQPPAPSRYKRPQQNMEFVRFARRLRAQFKLTSAEVEALDDIAGLFCSLQADMAQYEQHALTAMQVQMGSKTYFNDLSPILQAQSTAQHQRKAEVDEISSIVVQLQQQDCGDKEVRRLLRCQQRARHLAEKAWIYTGLYGSMRSDYQKFVLNRFYAKHTQYALGTLQDDFREIDDALSTLQSEVQEMEWTASVVAKAAEQLVQDVRQNPSQSWRDLNARLAVLDDFFNESDDEDDDAGNPAAIPTAQPIGLQTMPLSEASTRSNTPNLADPVQSSQEQDGIELLGIEREDQNRPADTEQEQQSSATRHGQRMGANAPKTTLGASFSAVEERLSRRGHVRASTMHASNYAVAVAGPPQLGSVIRRNGRSVPRIFTGSFDELEQGLERLRFSATNTSSASSANLTAPTAEPSSIRTQDFATPENGTPNSSIPSTPTIYLRRREAFAARDVESYERGGVRSRRLGGREEIIHCRTNGRSSEAMQDPPSSAPAYESVNNSFTEPHTRASSTSRQARHRENTL